MATTYKTIIRNRTRGHQTESTIFSQHGRDAVPNNAIARHYGLSLKRKPRNWWENSSLLGNNIQWPNIHLTRRLLITQNVLKDVYAQSVTQINTF